MNKLKHLPIELLKPHEQIIEDHVEELVEAIRKDGYIQKPIIVDKKSFVILDGHHRYTAATKLGYAEVPCLLIDYEDESIVSLQFWRENVQLTKQEVVQAGMEGRRFPPKTTRHILHIDYSSYFAVPAQR